ncbi:MAG: RDD family protein, partial [Acidimicrobiia bacterium]|nr:RDD family protein [Acidimicrobiia bacterium]
YVGFAFARSVLTSHPFALPHPPVWFTSTFQFLLLTGYLAWGWGSTGRTPGKALLGLRVVTDTGTRLRMARALARAALCALVGPLLLAWALVSRRNAGIHDLVLGTAVIYDWRPRFTRGG